MVVRDSNVPICSNTAAGSVDITRNALPTASISGATTICEGDNTNITFSLSGTGPFDVTYSDGSSNFNLNNISNGHIVTVNPSISTTYTLISVTDSNVPACSPTSLGSPITVTVNPLPTANIIPSAVTNGCAPLEVSFQNQIPGIGTETWLYRIKGTTTAIETTIGAFVYFTFENTTISDIIYEVVYEVVDGNGCINTDILEITVFPGVEPQFSIANSNTGCTPLTITFNNDNITANPNVIYIWNWGDGLPNDTTTSQTSIDHTFENFSSVTTSNYTVILTALDQSTLCGNIVTEMVTVFPFVQTNVQPDVIEGCGQLTVNFTNLTAGAIIHEWFYREKGTNQQKGVQNTFFASFELENSTSSDIVYEVIYEGTNGFGCSEDVITEITVFPELEPDFVADPQRSFINENDGRVTLTNNTPNKGSFDHSWDFGGWINF